MSAQTLQLIIGAFIAAGGVSFFVFALLLKRSTLKRAVFWRDSAPLLFWLGVGMLAMGFGALSRLVVSETAASRLSIIGSVVAIVTMLIASRHNADRL